MKRKEPSNDSDELEDIEDESFDAVIDGPLLRKSVSKKSKVGRPVYPTNKLNQSTLDNSKSNQEDNESWVEKYSPTTTSEICINPSKLKQLKLIMQEMLTLKNRRVLVITGPSGSSKSTSVKLLSNELGYGYIEYFNDKPGTRNFEEFLNDCKYLVGKNLKFIVIEELPNIFHKSVLESFRNKLLEWVYLNQNLPPIVICLTELERNFGSEESFGKNYNEFFNIENNLNINTVFGKEILNHPKVGILKFNSIASKFMKSTINRIIVKELLIFKQLPTLHINNFINLLNDIGDIRSSINNLELWSKYYHKGINLLNQGDNFGFNRNVTINLFHAIGKILYSSSKYKSSVLSNDQTNYLTIEEVLNNYENLQLLNLSILENYTNLLPDDGLNYCGFMADRLSESDLIYNLMEGKDLMIRSIRVGLDDVQCSSNSSSGYNRITFSKNFNMIKSINRIYKKIYQLKCNPIFFHGSFDSINMIDGYFVPLIINNRFSKQFNRIGGPFKGTSLNDDLYGDNSDFDFNRTNEIHEFDDYDDLYEFEKYTAKLCNPDPNLNVISTKDLDDEELSEPIEDSDQDQRKPLPFESDYEFLDESEFL